MSTAISSVELIDPHSGESLCSLYPLDKAANANAQRRRLETLEPALPAPSPGSALPPLLRRLLADYAATGRPPAYLPKDEEPETDR